MSDYSKSHLYITMTTIIDHLPGIVMLRWPLGGGADR